MAEDEDEEGAAEMTSGKFQTGFFTFCLFAFLPFPSLPPSSAPLPPTTMLGRTVSPSSFATASPSSSPAHVHLLRKKQDKKQPHRPEPPSTSPPAEVVDRALEESVGRLARMLQQRGGSVLETDMDAHDLLTNIKAHLKHLSSAGSSSPVRAGVAGEEAEDDVHTTDGEFDADDEGKVGLVFVLVIAKIISNKLTLQMCPSPPPHIVVCRAHLT